MKVAKKPKVAKPKVAKKKIAPKTGTVCLESYKISKNGKCVKDKKYKKSPEVSTIPPPPPAPPVKTFNTGIPTPPPMPRFIVNNEIKQTLAKQVSAIAREKLAKDLKEKVARQASADLKEKVARQASADLKEKVARQASADLKEKVARQASADLKEKVARQASAEAKEKVARQASADLKEKVARQASADLKEKVARQLSTDLKKIALDKQEDEDIAKRNEIKKKQIDAKKIELIKDFNDRNRLAGIKYEDCDSFKKLKEKYDAQCLPYNSDQTALKKCSKTRYNDYMEGGKTKALVRIAQCNITSPYE